METIEHEGVVGQNIFALRRDVVIKFLVFTGGIFLTFAAYCALLALQSSINIEDGVGAASATATYAAAAVFGVVLTPVILRVAGTKVSVVICQAVYLIYCIANFYPEAYILIPAGVIVGVGEATMWPTMMLFCVHYARCYARYGSKDTEFYVTEFIGYFYFIFQLSQAFGNLLSYAILYAGKAPIDQTSDAPTAASPVNITDSYRSITPSVGKDYSICGPNDCQSPNVTQQNIDQYVPTSETTLYIMIGVMAGLVLIAIAIHTIFTRKIDPTLEARDESKSRMESKMTTSESKKTAVQDADDNSHESTKERPWNVALSTVKATLLHLVDPKQLLLTPFCLYSGMFVSFGFGELTRAFASCMIGVSQVGLCMAIYSAADALTSFFICKVSSRIGRTIPMTLNFVLDIGNYMICLFWIPTDSTAWLVYIIFMIAGTIDGIWQPLINVRCMVAIALYNLRRQLGAHPGILGWGMIFSKVVPELHAAYFPEKQDIAFTVWNLWTLVGIAIQFGWSTSLCVREKIYIQIGILCFAMICLRIAEYIRGRKSSEKSEATNHTTAL